VQRIERHQSDGCGAIRIGDDAFVPSSRRLALISGIDERHVSSCRNALELSTTTQPALAAIGANSFEMLPPALNSAMSIPANESFVNSLTVISCPRNFSFLPSGARRGEQSQFAHRKISFFQRFDHFDADGAGRADHCHMRISVHKGRGI
jgi:hypothetical protein